MEKCMTLLFLLYTAKVERITQAHGLLRHCYRQYTTQVVSEPSQTTELKQRVLMYIKYISEQMAFNCLKVNPPKLKFLYGAPTSGVANYSTAVPSPLVNQDFKQPTLFATCKSILTDV